MNSSRFLFFTNECVGLGHLRRALSLARELAETDPTVSSLIVTGSPVELSHPPPTRIDTVKLPQLARDEDGTQRPRRLGIDLADVRALRSMLALAAAESFAPSVAVIDKTPLGLGDELEPALETLHDAGTRLVLGLRDIEDAPARVRRSWGPAKVRRAIERYYDAVLVYGPGSSVDALDCMGWHDLPVPVHHVGYVGSSLTAGPPADLPGSYLLVTAGGGADGSRLLSTFLAAVRLEPLPLPTLLVTGPLMPEPESSAIRALAEGLDVRVETFRPDLDAAIASARGVVAMAGYNTVSELLRTGRPALLVPRARPSREQLLRASAMRAAGRAQMLHPDELDPARMRAALGRLLDTPAHEPDGDHAGAARAVAILLELAALPDVPRLLAVAGGT